MDTWPIFWGVVTFFIQKWFGGKIGREVELSVFLLLITATLGCILMGAVDKWLWFRSFLLTEAATTLLWYWVVKK